ncbi:SpaH/EbpB family LPXTG-anchored major pilin [Enterococcus sp.]|uniref:SpaH/EbpB family LPXTG-anchored major pilin n=1 Tax=Enterococcus sp. TaxID=35783 RepID=UPI0025BA6498|nr:SpaH/EbpB family LPXTG-anchored major pilin [Enterococcus sp.]
MKQAKKVWYLLSALFLTLPVFISVLGTTVYAEDNASNAQIVIHKKKMTDLPNPLIQNSGKEMREFDQYQGLAEVTFRIYNVTSEFYAQRAAGATVEAAKQAVQGLTPGAPVAEGTTDAEGNMTVNVPKQQKGKDAVYTIKEEPKSGVVAAANLVIAFPVYEMIKQSDGSYKYGSEELSTVHVYPKNVVSNDGSLHVKKVGTAENESLNGAEFVLSKSEGSPSTTKYIQGVKDGLHTWTTDKGQAKHFVTGKSYGIGEDDFTESEENTGELTVKNLEVGAYILEEVKAPNNAELIADQTKTPFTIEADNQTPVEKTVKNDTSNVEKTTPNLNGKDVAIGEKIKYEIAVNIPLGIADKEGNANKYNKFNLVDTHDEALTFDNTPSGETAYALYDGETVIAPGNYQVTEQTNGFTVAVDPAFIPSLTPGGTLKFVYFMHLNEKADPTKGFKNEANVDNGHTNDQTPPTVEVVTGGKRFIKVDGDVSSTQALAGAAFVVRDQDSEQANYLKVDEAAKTTTWVANKEDATTFTTEADGLVVVTGLKYGVYYLEETAAPENYVLLTNRIQFTVDEHSYGTTEELVAPEKVPNKHKGTLPSTGGKGIYLYLGSGALILLVVGLYFMKRKESR